MIVSPFRSFSDLKRERNLICETPPWLLQLIPMKNNQLPSTHPTHCTRCIWFGEGNNKCPCQNLHYSRFAGIIDRAMIIWQSYVTFKTGTMWSNGLVVKALDSLSMGPVFKNHWVAPRSTQSFILPRSIKWVPGTYGNLVVKSKLPPRSDSWTLSVKWGHKVFFFFLRFSSIIILSVLCRRNTTDLFVKWASWNSIDKKTLLSNRFNVKK